jgi:NAD(P) transhydrogenase subunit beta
MNPFGGFQTLILLAYLAAAVLFILGIKMLSHPRTARRGNTIAAAGMIVAVLASFFMPGLQNLGLIIGALALGTIVGVVGARVVQMTDMPQMVALLNGLGGGAAALVSGAEFVASTERGEPLTGAASIAMIFGTIVGSIAFSGSVVAFAKLQGLVSEAGFASRVGQVVNAILLIALLGIAIAVGMGSTSIALYIALAAGALLFGVLIVFPVGGADMPVIVSLLNSCTGLAAASTGFVLHNVALIIAGTLVGASGALLTNLMCKAMNRSLANVMFAGIGGGGGATGGGGSGAATAGTVRDISVEDAGVLMANSQSVIIIPGYGMAVAQAQHAVRELADMLSQGGTEVRYAVHPVAGRMPGHMNVLLAEANVPYNQLYDLDDINPMFEYADVALVIGANDVVNPVARHDRSSPIYGMPIFDADKAKHVIIIKRSLKPGFAGIDNELYYDPKTYMLFGDAKSAVSKLNEAIRESDM